MNIQGFMNLTRLFKDSIRDSNHSSLKIHMNDSQRKIHETKPNTSPYPNSTPTMPVFVLIKLINTFFPSPCVDHTAQNGRGKVDTENAKGQERPAGEECPLSRFRPGYAANPSPAYVAVDRGHTEAEDQI